MIILARIIFIMSTRRTSTITDERHSYVSEFENDVIAAHSVHCLVKPLSIMAIECGRNGSDNSSTVDR